MPDQIFISHSREDEDLLDELDRVFGKVGAKQYRASFEDQNPPVSQTLKREINQSAGMFVVLGRRAQAKTHTMIWIGWEAGIAIQSGIPVWILEDVQSKVKQPIPSFTDHVLWDSQDSEQKRTLRDIIEREFVVGDTTTPSTKIEPQTSETGFRNTNRNGATVRDSTVSETVRSLSCPYESCGEEFNIRFEDVNKFNCPSCRQVIVLEKDNSGIHSY